MRVRQVSSKASWIELEQEDPFPSDDWYFTFHTITATAVYRLLGTVNCFDVLSSKRS